MFAKERCSCGDGGVAVIISGRSQLCTAWDLMKSCWALGESTVVIMAGKIWRENNGNLCGAAGHVARDEGDEILAQAGADCHSHTHLRKRQGGVEYVGRMEGLEEEEEEVVVVVVVVSGEGKGGET